MDQKHHVISLIYKAIDEINKFFLAEKRLEKKVDTILWDEETGGNLDSLGMVNFIVVLEQEISKEWGVSLMLADDLIITTGNNPFQSIDTLSDNICILLKEATTH